VLSTLEERGLISELGRAETAGRPLLYGTTPAFLERFGLPTLDALPPLPAELRSLIAG
jgi:segregation and condensation protein B